MTTLPEVNQGLFRKIRDGLKAHPESHDNDSWEILARDALGRPLECGTTRCTADWAIWFQHPGQPIRATLDELPDNSFSEAGGRLLGLTYHEAEYLFYNDNELAMAMIEHFAEKGREGWAFPVSAE